jgi:hypothetical protein
MDAARCVRPREDRKKRQREGGGKRTLISISGVRRTETSPGVLLHVEMQIEMQTTLE